jgi:UDP-2-acetamido-3-amino-2,3-dideoxy-glucuronate N-acetyltransferase
MNYELDYYLAGANRLEPPSLPGSLAAGSATLRRTRRFIDERGSLVVIQAPIDMPFVPVRLFQVGMVPTSDFRGEHAHRRCHQLLIAAAGNVDVVVDDGQVRSVVTLNSSDLALHIPPLVWGIQMNFSSDAALIVLASEGYDRTEYIEDYDEFLRIVGSSIGN